MIFQAERRFHESSQKLDLLQCSLTRLMGELSPEQAAVGIYKDYITTPPSYADRKAVGLGKQQYTAITKPAALTGELYVSNAKSIYYQSTGVEFSLKCNYNNC